MAKRRAGSSHGLAAKVIAHTGNMLIGNDISRASRRRAAGESGGGLTNPDVEIGRLPARGRRLVDRGLGRRRIDLGMRPLREALCRPSAGNYRGSAIPNPQRVVVELSQKGQTGSATARCIRRCNNCFGRWVW